MGQNETIPTGDALRMKHQGSTSDGYGLRNRLMVIFVLFALFPVLCLGILAYSTIHAFLYDNLQNNMETVVTLKTGDVKRYFQQMRQDIQIQARRPSIQNFMKNLNSYLNQSGLSPDTFVKSGVPDRLAKTVKFMSYSQDSGDYSNVLLVDLNGDILYALTEKNDMGANVFGGHFKDTNFSGACRKARRSANPVFSDYEIRNVAGEERVFGHMICPLRDEDNRVIGLLVLQSDLRYLDHIMAEHLNLGQSFEIYLVGQDGFLRTDSGKRHERKAMKSVIDNEWLSDFDQTEDVAGSKGEIPLMAYQGLDGIPLLGMHTRFSIGDIRYEMVAEMEKLDAFPLMDRLWFVFLVFMGIGVITAVGAAFVIADNMIRPIRALTGWALNVATGDLAQMEIKAPDDEIGQFNHSFRQMVGFLKATSRLAIDISSGDYSAEINPRSPYDEMGAALKRMTESLRDASRAMAAVADGDFTVRVTVKGPNDLLARSVNGMVEKIRKTSEDSEKQARLKSLKAELNELMRGDQNLHELSAHILGFLCANFNGAIGAFYVSEEDGAVVRLYSGFALRGSDGLKDVIHDGDGLIGQVLREKRKIILDYCPENYVRVHSLVSDLKPSSILIFPFVREEILEGIIEMGFLGNMMERDMHFLEYVSESICIALSSARSRLKMKELLDKTVRQATDLIIKQDELNAINKDLQESEARLKKQESELRDINRDLVQQAVKLRESERRLKTKEEELLAANESLKIRSLYLEQQKNAINEKNIELEKTKDALIEKTNTLENSSRYKSEFLANMSHELRTPLNSILLISRLINENKWGNLNDRQIEFAKTIHGAGMDLMALIDDILDLSKLEAGKFDIVVEKAAISDLRDRIVLHFADICREKGIELKTEIDPHVPEYVYIDLKRMDQVVKNLVSNAVKFTNSGYVRLVFSIPDHLPQGFFDHYEAKNSLRITVEDTGTGIPDDKKEVVFQAFRQVDGTISRQYGGTGLGLSISRELVRLMNGEILLDSIEGQGSVFTVFVPDVILPPKQHNGILPGKAIADSVEPEKMIKTPVFSSDTNSDHGSDGSAIDPPWVDLSGRKILIVDDDMRNVYSILNALGDQNPEVLVGKTGRECLEILDKNPSVNLVLMDIMMPEMDGFEAIERIRDQKRFECLPVIVLTAKTGKDDRDTCFKSGATEYLSKPVDMNRLISVINKRLT